MTKCDLLVYHQFIYAKNLTTPHDLLLSQLTSKYLKVQKPIVRVVSKRWIPQMMSFVTKIYLMHLLHLSHTIPFCTFSPKDPMLGAYEGNWVLSVLRLLT